MKLITKLSTAIAFGLVSLSINVFAQTPVSCVWTNGNAYNVHYRLCHDGSATGPVAASEVVNIPSATCTLSASAGYSVTGTCGTAKVSRVQVPTVCPNNGAIYPQLIVVGYNAQPFPTAAVQAFCGDVSQCKITTETVSVISYNSSLVRAVCRNY